MRLKNVLPLLALVGMLCGILPPSPSIADSPQLSPVSGNPLTVSTTPYLYMSGLQGQSACAISVSGSFSGTVNVQGFYPGDATATSSLQLASPDGQTFQTGITAPGKWIFNCANMRIIRADATGVTGTPLVTLNASGGVGRVVFKSTSGTGITTVNGTSPINVSTVAGVATVSISPLPSSVPPSITSSNTNTTVATPSANTFVLTTVTPAPPSITSANTNTVVATPAANTYVITTVTPAPPAISGTGIATVTNPSTNTYVVNVPSPAAATLTGLTAGLNIVSPLTGPTPTVATVTNPFFAVSTQIGAAGTTGDSGGGNLILGNNQTIAGNMTFIRASSNALNAVQGVQGDEVDIYNNNGSFNQFALDHLGNLGIHGYLASGTLTSGQCVQATTNGQLVSTGAACGTGAASQLLTGASFVVPTFNNPVTVTLAAPATFFRFTPLTISDGVNYVQGQVNASMTNSTSLNFYVISSIPGGAGTTILSGAGVYNGQAGSVLQVSGSGNVTITGNGNSTPTVTVTAAPTFANVTDSALTTGQCVQASTAGILVSAAAPCAGATNSPTYTGTVTAGGYTTASGTYTASNIGNYQFGTSNIGCVTSTGTALNANSYPCAPLLSLSFTFPAVGSTGTVTPVSNITAKAFTPVTISDGTNAVTGYVNTSVANSATFSFTTLQILSGTAASNVGGTVYFSGLTPAAPTFANVTDSALTATRCVQSGTVGLLGVATSACMKSEVNGTAQTGAFHVSTFNNQTITTGSTATYTFQSTYGTAPVCLVSRSANSTLFSGNLYPSTISTTSVIVSNNTGSSQTPGVVCFGV